MGLAVCEEALNGLRLAGRQTLARFGCARAPLTYSISILKWVAEVAMRISLPVEHETKLCRFHRPLEKSRKSSMTIFSATLCPRARNMRARTVLSVQQSLVASSGCKVFARSVHFLVQFHVSWTPAIAWSQPWPCLT